MDAQQIDYAPHPLRRRRRVRRIPFILALLRVIFAPLVWKFGPFAWKQAQILYWQRQAMNYSPPGIEVVFRNDPDRNENVFVHRAFIDDGVFKRSMVPSAEFAQLAAIDCDLIPVVLHDRSNRSGIHYLVVVEFAPRFFGHGDMFTLLPPTHFHCMVIRPASTIRPASAAYDEWLELEGDNDPRRHYQLNAGQFDPNDSSHFTFQETVDGKPMLIDGWLTDDAQIKLERRR